MKKPSKIRKDHASPEARKKATQNYISGKKAIRIFIDADVKDKIDEAMKKKGITARDVFQAGLKAVGVRRKI